jgi:hypothetical protein
MFLPVSMDRWPETLSAFIARRWNWTPLDKEIAVTIDDSDDDALAGRSLCGTVRAFDVETGMLLVHLMQRVTYEGHYTARDFDIVVTVPAIRGHHANRLLLTWVAVRIVEAPSFVQQGFGRTIGTARLVLSKCS